jgi:hypothetical protein
MDASNQELVILKSGLSVRRPALQLALQLEEQGFSISTRADGRLEVQPAARLTSDDCRAIRAHRDDLIRIVLYEAPAVG